MAISISPILAQHREWLRDSSKGARADLRGADLREADLSDTVLSGADLSGADLSGADLTEAELDGVDLRGAFLREASLSGANLSGASGILLPKALPIDNMILQKIQDNPKAFSMHSWHGDCGTAHCLAGWATVLHPEGDRLERDYGVNVAGALIYAAAYPGQPVPDWFASDAEALAATKTRAAQYKGPRGPL